MTETNWALGANGATVVGVSHEASHVSSTANNLLVDREDQLWITGDAPQHVILMLAESHPPLRYAGWCVWHDYLTNPKRVEIAAGGSLVSLTPLLVCQALPGAGTQVWELPKPIPTEHRYVRFTISETFGPGPTYMNNVVLLANDPGPNYCGSTPAAAATADPRMPPDRSASVGADNTNNNYNNSGTPRGGYSLNDRPPRAGAGVGGGRYQSQHLTPGVPAQVSPRPSSSLHQCMNSPAGDSVGVFARPIRSGGGGGGVSSTPTGPALDTPTSGSMGLGGGGGGSNSGRMSQLLRDLDEDIRSLRPIKTVSPKKDMLLYVPQDQPMLITGNPDSDGGGSDYSSDEEECSRSSTGSSRDASRRQRRRHGRRHGGTRTNNGAGSSSGRHRHLRSADRRDTQPPPQAPESPPAAAPSKEPQPAPQVQQPPWPVYSHTAAPPAPPVAVAPVGYPTALVPAAAGGVYDRISALEQAVASLTQTVQHQREDITMMKRLLLQQSQERRKEAELAKQRQHQQHRQEQEREEQWRRRRWSLERKEKSRSVAIAPAHALQDQASSAAGLSTGQDWHLTRHHVDVDFPEDALRGFVQAVLEERLRKNLKKSESKVLNRLDNYLRDVVASIADGVDERVRWHLEQADGGQQPAPPPPPQQQTKPRPGAGTGQPTNVSVPAMSIDHTTLSGSGGAGNINNNVSGVFASAQPSAGLASSGAPSPVISRSATESGPLKTSVAAVPASGAPPVDGPSLHRYNDARPRAAPPLQPWGGNRYAPM